MTDCNTAPLCVQLRMCVGTSGTTLDWIWMRGGRLPSNGGTSYCITSIRRASPQVTGVYRQFKATL